MTVDDPESRPTHERLNDLEATVAELQAELADLRKAVAEADAEAATEDTLRDRYDAPVLDALDDGELVTTKRLKVLYRTKTPIQQDSTVQDRIKSLTDRSEFDFQTPGKWLYRDGGSADE